MTLSVSLEEIIISNADGTTKFTSNDRLLFRTNMYTGTVTLGGGLTYERFGVTSNYRQQVLLTDANIGNRLNWDIDDSNLITIKVRPTYMEGNLGNRLLGNTFDLSNGLVVDYTQTSGNYRLVQHTTLSAFIKKFNRNDSASRGISWSTALFGERDGLPVVEFTYYDISGNGNTNSTVIHPYPATFNGQSVDAINDVKTPTKIITFAYEISIFRWK
jgi:hypothetical protein